MRRIRQTWPLLLLTIFWIAQVQGTVHAISHLRVSDAATNKHTSAAPGGFCGECEALAQSGAAPLISTPAGVSLLPPKHVGAASTLVSLAAPPANYYRSRAPPRSPI